MEIVIFLTQNGYFNRKRQEYKANKAFPPEMVEHELANLRQVVFEVTDACNLQCKYCGYGEFYGDYNDRTNSYMTFEMAKAIIDFLIPFWESPQHTSSKKDIDIAFYGGEPLLNIRLIKRIIDYIESKNIKYSNIGYSMTTNAMLLKKTYGLSC